MKLGKCLGYSRRACPKCGRVRLERYENGIEVCEKCNWCPQENRYVSQEEIYSSVKDNDYDYGLNLGPASYQEATSNYNEAIKTCIASGKADEILSSDKAKALKELDAQVRSAAPTTGHATKEILANFANEQKE